MGCPYGGVTLADAVVVRWGGRAWAEAAAVDEHAPIEMGDQPNGQVLCPNRDPCLCVFASEFSRRGDREVPCRSPSPNLLIWARWAIWKTREIRDSANTARTPGPAGRNWLALSPI